MSTLFVVEADFSDLVQGVGLSSRYYVRLWDILQAIGGLYISAINDVSFPCELPAPDIKTIFNSLEYGLLVFKKLHIDSGIGVFKLDRLFFIKYPELYDANEECIAAGIPIAPVNQTSIPGPRALDRQVRCIYAHLVQWSFNMLFNFR
jgi:hypothetical protein